MLLRDNESAEEISRRLVAEVDYAKSHIMKDLYGMHLFENFVLTKCPGTAYAQFLMKLKPEVDLLLPQHIAHMQAEGVVFMVRKLRRACASEASRTALLQAPPEELLYRWFVHLRYGDAALETYSSHVGTYATTTYEPVLTVNTIYAYFHQVAAIHNHIGATAEIVSKKLRRQLKSIQRKHDAVRAAHSFPLEETLPKIAQAVSNVSAWNLTKKMMLWVMSLVTMATAGVPFLSSIPLVRLQLSDVRCAVAQFAIGIMGRGSDVSEFCPLIEDLQFPDDKELYGRDGIPKYVDVYMREWKGHRNKEPYPIRMWRNFLQPDKYCPVLWLMVWLLRLRDNFGIVKGPIFPAIGIGQGLSTTGRFMTQKQWADMCRTVFTYAKLYTRGTRACSKTGTKRVASKGLTSHSFRKAAAVWAARCGATIIEIQNTGRWKDCETLARYLAQGTLHRNEKLALYGKDPIANFWMYRPTSVATSTGQSRLG